MGLAQHLKETSMFYLPNKDASSACIYDFKTHLLKMGLPDFLVPSCLNDTNEFVIKPSSCAGILSVSDWIKKVGSSSVLDSSCDGDLSESLTKCGSCYDAGMKVTSQLVTLDPNSTKCFYFSVFYAAGVVNSFGPKDPRVAACILSLPLSTSANKKGSNNLSRETVLKLVSGLLGSIMGILVAFGLFVLYRRWDMRRKVKAMHEKYVSGMKSQILPTMGAKWFDITELELATNGFSQRNMIGQGGSGVVYKGVLSDGNIVAVKQIMDLEATGDDEFRNEAEMISKIRHRNLLSLRGFCVTSDIFKGKGRYLVYDFMPNGSLEDHLFNLQKNQQLTWPQRKNIILDVAKGLAYLHHGIKPAIYHRDIKATNILLDSEMKARVADFGLAKQSTEGQSHLTTRVAGTYGYLAPEYALYGQLTEKSDVYSFGIVILETISGRKVLDASNSSALLITDWAWGLVKSENVEDVFHESIRNEGPRGVMERFVLVGILCAHVMVALRPTISEALRMLEGDIDIPRLPDRPLPLSHESFRSSSSMFSMSTIHSSSRSNY
ncbi:hypothetical protein M9H77_18445 [Catharanthus roseus]|uniref:Uncharacterized protein n=1 Tax=Catharanthus roseus TaxID=4058 RepID=A0ACC0B7I8_CATRO|nr:hypothetical protein M9H77_18445 [Catharanthus roseus]